MLVMIFNNAIMYNSDFATRNMRMRIVFGHTTMGRPTSMANTDNAVQLFRFHFRLHIGYTTDGANAFDAAVQYCDAGRIVAAILKAAQAFDQDRNHITLRNRADYATHIYLPLYFWCLA